MSSAQPDPVEILRDAIAKESKIEPGDRFDELVRSGLIDQEGNVVRPVAPREDEDSDAP